MKSEYKQRLQIRKWKCLLEFSIGRIVTANLHLLVWYVQSQAQKYIVQTRRKQGYTNALD